MKHWITDPTTKQESVSLTLLMVSFSFAIAAAALHLAKVTDNTSTCTELFYSCTALYFGRRFSFNGKTYSSSDAPKDINTVVKTSVESITDEKSE